MEEYLLEKSDEVLLLDKGFHQEVFGTYWRSDKDNNAWCVDLSSAGNYMLFAVMHSPGLLTTSQTMSRERFEEIFA